MILKFYIIWICSSLLFRSLQRQNNLVLWGIVNNAGIFSCYGPDDWLSIDDYKLSIEVNTLGVIRTTQVGLFFRIPYSCYRRFRGIWSVFLREYFYFQIICYTIFKVSIIRKAPPSRHSKSWWSRQKAESWQWLRWTDVSPRLLPDHTLSQNSVPKPIWMPFGNFGYNLQQEWSLN